MTKVFTPPVRERFGDTKGVTGATMEDGTVYRSRQGVMTVDRADHIAAMKRDPRVAENIAVETFHGGPKVRGRHCPTCKFSAWDWQMTCPRDGTPTKEDE